MQCTDLENAAKLKMREKLRKNQNWGFKTLFGSLTALSMLSEESHTPACAHTIAEFCIFRRSIFIGLGQLIAAVARLTSPSNRLAEKSACQPLVLS
jgi:hypothetical protein